MLNVAWPLSSGVSKHVLAGRVGETVGWVNKQLAALAVELEQQALPR